VRVALAWLGLALAAPALEVAGLVGAEADRTRVYREVGEVELEVGVFLPGGAVPEEPAPAVVFFFGGGWKGGNRGHFAMQARYLAGRGMVVFCPDYRIESKHGTPPRECVVDAMAAMRWVSTHAEAFGVDPERIAAGGGSAGGHLAAAVALLDGFGAAEGQPRPAALLLFNPVFDNGPGGYGHERVKDYWREFSPAHQLDEEAPPTLVLLGDRDPLVPVATAKAYRERMRELGRRCELVLYPGRAHGFFNHSKGARDFAATLIESDRFLGSLGWLEGEPTLVSPAEEP